MNSYKEWQNIIALWLDFINPNILLHIMENKKVLTAVAAGQNKVPYLSDQYTSETPSCGYM